MSRWTVAKLIRELKKQPPTAYVAFRSHDNSETDIDGYVSYLESSIEGGIAELVKARESELEGHHVVVLGP